MNIVGDLSVGGNITAQEFHTEYVTSSVIFQSGSTKFGDTSDDTHQFTGSILLDGAMTAATTGSFGYIEVAGEQVVSNVIIDGGSF